MKTISIRRGAVSCDKFGPCDLGLSIGETIVSRVDVDGFCEFVIDDSQSQGESPECFASKMRSTPSFADRVKSFAIAAFGHVAAGMPMASDEEIIRRHDICLTCEHLQNDACNLCGCPVSRVAGYVSKLSWADQECPIGKWGKATPSG